MRILDRPALDHTEYLACLAAFSRTLDNLLAETENALARLAGKRKGAHFGWEIALDRARYGVLIVLERWKELNQRFELSIGNTPAAGLSQAAAARCEQAAAALQAAYLSLDELDEYVEMIVAEAIRRLRAVRELFNEERQAAREAGEKFAGPAAALAVLGAAAGPSPAEVFRGTHDAFLTDLSER